MNGPQHYAEAERLLREAGATIRERAATSGPGREALRALASAGLAAAQVHATLAVVAATVGNAEQDFDKVDEHVTAWAQVLA